MNKTSVTNSDKKILVDTDGLKNMLSSGRQVAEEIGTKAGAKVKIGRRIFWNVSKIEKYLDGVSDTRNN